MSKTVINAPNAELRTNFNNSKSPKRNKNNMDGKTVAKPRNNKNKPKAQPASGIGTGLGPQAYSDLFKENAALTDAGEGWVQAYIDPCGVHRTSLDLKRPGDGAFPISAIAEFRFIDTVSMPFNTIESVDMTGKNFSLLILQSPLMRGMAILVCHIHSREFDDVVMSSFSRAFAQIQSRNDAYYPNWVPCDLVEIVGPVATPVLFFTVLTPSALKAIQEPDSLGISTFLNQFRFTTYGVEVDHNTPTLFDQGTFVTGCFNCSVEPYTYEENHVRSFDPFYLNLNVTPGPVVHLLALIEGAPAPALSTLNYVGTLPSPLILMDFTLRNSSGSVVFPLGSFVLYENLGALCILRQNLTSNYLVLGPVVVNSNQQTRLYSRIELLDTLTEAIYPADGQVNKLILPPCTQADIQQMNVSAVHGLLKDCVSARNKTIGDEASSCYLSNRIWEPVFLPQDSTNFRKCIIVSQGDQLADLVDGSTGWHDSFDKNFGWGVMNLQSVPWAAAPLIHAVRTDEQVPGHNSIIGAYATRAGYKEPLALDIALTASSRLPHGHVRTGGNGGLFNKITNMLQRLPKVLATGGNVASRLSEIIDNLYS
jgi:hypothetical protein